MFSKVHIPQNLIILIVLFMSFFFAYRKRYSPLLFLISVATINAPLFKVGYHAIPFQYFSFFPLIFAVFARRKVTVPKSMFKMPIPVYLILVTFILIVSLMSTVLTNARTSLAEPFLFGTFRGMILCLVWLILVTILLTRLSRKEILSLISKIITFLAVANFTACIVQIFIGLPELFYLLYHSASLTPLETVLAMGRFPRAYGLFGSPVNLGALVLTVSALALILRKRGTYLLSLVIAIFSLSKTAILGLPIVTILWFSLKTLGFGETRKQFSTKRVLGIVFVSFAGVIVLLLLPNILRDRNMPVDYYFKYLRHPIQALESRYDPALGSGLSETIEVIKQYPLLGTGYTVIKEEFIGDSTYLVLLKTTGIIGLVTYILFMGFIMLFFFQRRSMFILLPLISLMSGVALPAWVSFEQMFFLQASLIITIKPGATPRKLDQGLR